MTDRIAALQNLLAKHEEAHRKIPAGSEIFKGIDGPRAARLATEAVIEQFMGDIRALIAQEKIHTDS